MLNIVGTHCVVLAQLMAFTHVGILLYYVDHVESSSTFLKLKFIIIGTSATVPSAPTSDVHIPLYIVAKLSLLYNRHPGVNYHRPHSKNYVVH